jgi:hypothetical protein
VAVGLINGLALMVVDIQVAVRGQFLGRSLAAQKPFVITVSMAFGLVIISLWLWMANANGQGRNWARILSTVLFVLATLTLRGDFTQPVSPAPFGVTVLYYGGVVPFVAAWLVGAAAVWLLWRPASTPFFKPPGSIRHCIRRTGRTRPAPIVQGTHTCSVVRRADWHKRRSSARPYARRLRPLGYEEDDLVDTLSDCPERRIGALEDRPFVVSRLTQIAQFSRPRCPQNSSDGTTIQV